MDEYQEWLRCTAATAGNDHRLGADEAPPAIISIFLGDELDAVIRSIVDGTSYTDLENSVMKIGVDVMPTISRDTTDRNRTSPIAFTGNKFEFRMLGSSQSVSGPNIALNTIMAEELSRFADELEKAEDFEKALQELVCREFRAHQRILFGGNGYSQQWKEEAAKLGLSNLPSTADAMPLYVSQKNIDLVTKHGIFAEDEFRARYEIHMENYAKVINIEALTSIDMIRHQILPAAIKYTGHLAEVIANKNRIGVSCKAERDLVDRLSTATDKLYEYCEKLDADLKKVPVGDYTAAAKYYSDVIIKDMNLAREQADLLETFTDKAYWPYPTYSDLLFY